MTPPVQILQKNGSDIYPKTSVDAITGLDTYLIDKIYPVGAIYISANDINPSTLFGGTWEKYAEGRTLIGVSDTHLLGEEGGEETHTLTVAEMATHNHP